MLKEILEKINYEVFKKATDDNKIKATLDSGSKIYVVGQFGSLVYIEDESGSSYDIEIGEIKKVGW